MAPRARRFFDVGLHASQARVHWLAELRDDFDCFLAAPCRAANDALLFSRRFAASCAPEWALDGFSTDVEFLQQAAGLLQPPLSLESIFMTPQVPAFVPPPLPIVSESSNETEQVIHTVAPMPSGHTLPVRQDKVGVFGEFEDDRLLLAFEEARGE